MRSTWIGLVFALALASACSQTVLRDHPNTLFNASEYSTQASRGTVSVTVLGAVAGLKDKRLSDAVVRQMQGADWPPHARFVPGATPGQGQIYSYVLLFNGPVDVTSADLCAHRAAALPTTFEPRTFDSVILVAGLCRYDKVASGVTARASKVLGPADTDFQRLIVTTIQELTGPNSGAPNEGGMGDTKGGQS
jgi:hypothetical protein